MRQVLLVPVALLFVWAWPLRADAQLVAPHLKQVTVREGLPSDHVNAIATDGRGQVWVATANGLCQYDGRHVRSFHPAPGRDALPSGNVSTLCVIGRTLYIGTDAPFLTLLDVLTDSIRNVPLPVPAFSRHGEQLVTAIHQDRSGTVWVAHGARCLSRFDPSDRSFRTVEVPPPVPTPSSREVIARILEDQAGILWLAMFKGLVRFDPRTDEVRPMRLDPGAQQGHDPVFQITAMADADSALVLGTWGEGVFSMRKRDGSVRRLWPKEERRPTYKDHMVKDMAWMGKDALLVATLDMGILRLDALTGRCERFDRSLDQDRCRRKEVMVLGASCLAKADDVFLAGSHSGGLFLWPRRTRFEAFPLPTHAEADNDEVFDAFHDANARRDIVLSHQRGLVVYGGADVLDQVIRPDADPDRRMLSMERLKDGRIVVTGPPDTWVVDPDLQRIGSFGAPRTTPCGGALWWVRQGPLGDFWCLGLDGGLHHFDPRTGTCATLRERHPSVAALMGEWPLDVLVDPQGRTWFLSDAHGPVVLYPDGHAAALDGPPGLATFHVSDIAATPDGTLWLMARNSGLVRVPAEAPANGPLVAEDFSHDLRIRTVLSMRAMQDGSLWLAAPGGLQRYEPNTGSCLLLTAMDGLPRGPLNLGREQRPLGAKLLIGCLEGHVRLDTLPQALRPPPEVQLPKVWAGDDLLLRHGDLYSGPAAQVPHDHARIAIQLRCNDLLAPERVALAYRLIGMDTAWSVIGAEDRITFSSLAPGRYRFEVKARTDAGPWGSPTRLSFDVKPPFWGTWWFRTLAGLACAALLWSVFKAMLRRRLRRQRQVLEKERALLEERMRIAHDLHDDLGTGLASIGMESELAIMEASDPATRDALRRVSVNVRNVGDDMRRIVWAMGSGQETLGDLVAYVRALAGETLDLADVELRFEQDISDPSRVLSMRQRKHLVLFTKEALHNVVKHAHARSVTVQVEERAGALRWMITDNGRGYEPVERDGAGTGTTSMRERARALHAELQVVSAPGQGTRIRLALQLTDVY